MMIDAKDLPKHGIDAHREDLTFSHDLLTAAGNFYDDGTAIPENTLITHGGEVEEGVLELAS